MKLLLTGDIHLGRASTRFPADAGQDVSTKSAWQQIVNFALEQSIDVLLISGDLIDSANKRWEARGPIEAGLLKLAEAGIEILLVSGNHDHDVLPPIVQQLNLPGIKLLGKGGCWTRHTVQKAGAPALHVDGFSFPAMHLQDNPLNCYDLPPDPYVPTVAIVHGDLDSPASRYGPLSMAALEGHPVAGWLLGHIHAPKMHAKEGRPWVLYPGSPQPMDPGEPGLHGVWICKVEQGSVRQPECVPLSALRYDNVNVDISGVNDIDELEGQLTTEVRQKASEYAKESEYRLKTLSLRVNVTGESKLGPHLDAEAERIVRDLVVTTDNVTVHIDRLVNAIRPPLDLQSLAEGESVAATLARLILDLEGDASGQPATDLLRRIDQNVDSKISHTKFAPLDRRGDDQAGSAPPAESITDLALRQARLLLVKVLEQTA